jgi:hypothetical protein
VKFYNTVLYLLYSILLIKSYTHDQLIDALIYILFEVLYLVSLDK